MKPPLYNHQKETIEKIISQRTDLGTQVALLGDCGIGKSRIAIEIAERLKLFPAIIFCPAHVVETWMQQCIEWYGAFKCINNAFKCSVVRSITSLFLTWYITYILDK